MKAIGATIEQVRRKRGLTRPQLAERMKISPQTVFNIERDRSYNHNFELLDRLEKALGIVFELEIKEKAMSASTMRWGNDEGILYIRKNYPDCTFDTRTIGKKTWEWLRDRGAQKIRENADSFWGKVGSFINAMALPETAAQFEFDRSILPELYTFLDLLGQS